MTTGVTSSAQIAELIERQIEEAFEGAIDMAERAGDHELAGRIRLEQLGHALEGFTYKKRGPHGS